MRSVFSTHVLWDADQTINIRGRAKSDRRHRKRQVASASDVSSNALAL